MIERVHSLLVHVADLDTAANDYARLFGHGPVRRARRDGVRSVWFALANVALELREIGHDADVYLPLDPAPGQASLRFALMEGFGGDPGGETVEEALATRGLGIRHAERSGETCQDDGPTRQYSGTLLDASSSRGLPVELIDDEDPPIEAPERDADPSHVTSLDHLVIFSPAPDDTARFYGEQLGLRLALDKSFEKRGVRLLFFRVGGTTVEIGSRLGGEPQPEKPDRFGGLAWQVPDVEAIQARLAADGFDVSETRPGNKPGTRVCTVRDPVHGVPTLLIQPVDRD